MIKLIVLYITPLLTHHHSVISNLSSFLDTTSRGVLLTKDDDNSTGSTNTGSTGSLAELAINQFQTNWKDLDFWKAGQG